MSQPDYINPINLSPENGLYAAVFRIYGINAESVAACQKFAMARVEARITLTLASERLRHYNNFIERVIKDASRQVERDAIVAQRTWEQKEYLESSNPQ